MINCLLCSNGNASIPRIMSFGENENYMEVYFTYYSLYSINGLYKNSNAKANKMAKIEVSNTQLSVCFETCFAFPEHCACCLWR